MEATITLYNPSGMEIKVDATRKQELLARGFTESKEGVVHRIDQIPEGEEYTIKNASGVVTVCDKDLIAGCIKRGALLLEVDGKPYGEQAPRQEDPAPPPPVVPPVDPPAPSSKVDVSVQVDDAKVDKVKQAIAEQSKQLKAEDVAKALQGKSKEELYAKAKELGLSVTKKMGEDTLIAMISEAKAESV